MSFHDLGLAPSLRRAVADLGFAAPTPIQTKAIPPALAGRDLLACAMTGSGKTAAFLLPLLQRLGERRSGGPRALVLAPTRELAAQVHENLEAFARHTGLTGTVIFGGVNARPQERALRAGVDVVVATPGRLLDLMGQGIARLDRVEILVLDEADRMLDMGFLPDVERILAKVPRNRQTMLFSATMPAPIVSLSRRVLVDPERLDVERASKPARTVEQAVLPVPQSLKPALLVELLRRDLVSTALVFTRTKHRANRLTAHLEAAGIACDRIHGNRSQKQRETALDGFKRGKLRVLVATDIAARGIDVEALPFVVNFDVPGQAEDYVHRVGRTGRAEATGEALTFVAPEERGDLAAIERAVGRTIDRRRLEGFDYEARPDGRFEIPIQERIAAIRTRKAEERARARAKAERKIEAERRRGPSAPSGERRPATPARDERAGEREGRSRGARPVGARAGRERSRGGRIRPR